MGYIMLLLKSWQESFTLLIPKNMKLFLLVSLKSAAELYKALLYQYWYILLFFIITEVGFYALNEPAHLFQFIIFFLILLSRPSVQYKNGQYLINNVRSHVWGLLGIGTLLGVCYVFVPYTLFICLALMSVFAAFFYADSYGSLQDWQISIWRACNMFIFNLPVCLVAMTICALFYKICLLLLGGIGYYFFFLFTPFMVSYFKNIYVKRLHDQFNLYYVV